MTEEEIYNLAEELADEVFGSNGIILYSERQILASKFYAILSTTII